MEARNMPMMDHEQLSKEGCHAKQSFHANFENSRVCEFLCRELYQFSRLAHDGEISKL